MTTIAARDLTAQHWHRGIRVDGADYVLLGVAKARHKVLLAVGEPGADAKSLTLTPDTLVEIPA